MSMLNESNPVTRIFHESCIIVRKVRFFKGALISDLFSTMTFAEDKGYCNKVRGLVRP